MLGTYIIVLTIVFLLVFPAFFGTSLMTFILEILLFQPAMRKTPFLALFLQAAVTLLLVFVVIRFVFWSYNTDALLFSEWLLVQQNAWRMDISAVAYLMLIPLLLYFINQLFPSEIWRKLWNVYFVFVLLMVAIISTVDVCLYREWLDKFNVRALSYLKRPEEVIKNAGWYYISRFVVLSFLFFLIGHFLWRKWIFKTYFDAPHNRISLLIFPLWIAILVIFIRGGLQEIPLQESDAYFSQNQKLNDASVNSFWNFTASVVHSYSYRWKNPYRYFSEEELKRYPLANISASQSILKTERPNIVFIILEGWTADLIGANHPDIPQSCSPQLDSMAKQGIFFSNAYASGERSDQGITAILTSFPALPMGAIINDPKNIPNLPSISAELKKEGYTNLFLFGGQLAYGNLKALIYKKNFDVIIEEKDIDPKLYRGRLGVHDEHTFELFNDTLSQFPQPFFASIFTQSTHFHYDYPNPKNTIQWAGEHNMYANSILYSDSCMGDFFRKAKNEAWYANTLFVILPDHSHRSPREASRYTADFHHIPLLLFGEVIVDSLRGKRIDYPVSQCGVSGTILQEMNMDASAFYWGYNLLNEDSAKAYFVFTEGVGLVQPDGKISYDSRNKKVVQFEAENNDTLTLLFPAKAYLQQLYQATYPQ